MRLSGCRERGGGGHALTSTHSGNRETGMLAGHHGITNLGAAIIKGSLSLTWPHKMKVR